MSLVSLFTILLAAAVATSIAKESGSRCTIRVERTYEFPSTPLHRLNHWLRRDADYRSLVAAGCSDVRPAGDVCFDKPAIGSGLTQLRPNYFLGLTDRGPNQDCKDLSEDPKRYPEAVGKKGKGFPVRRFAPTIVHFKISKRSTKLIPHRFVPLRGSDRKPISGLPNTKEDDIAYAKDCTGEPLPLDPSGLDTEDLARIPGTSYVAIVDEYAPSVVVANYKTGVIAARHVPARKKRELKGARYRIIGDLPDVFAERRKNRGFESVVVDKKGKYVIACLQSTLLGADEDTTKTNPIARCAYFSVRIRKRRVPSLKFRKAFKLETSPQNAYSKKDGKPAEIKLNAAQYLSKNKFLMLERGDAEARFLKYEIPTKKVLKANNRLLTVPAPLISWTPTEATKLEGFVIDKWNKDTLYVINDNDFGLNNERSTILRKISIGRPIHDGVVCSKPKHPLAPRINLTPSKEIRLINSATYRISKTPDAGAAENFDVDEIHKRAYVANSEAKAVDSYSLTKTPSTPIKSYKPGNGFEPTSVSYCKKHGGKVAIALAHKDNAMPGRIDILSSDFKLYRKIVDIACILPDHLKWSEDCSYLVAACEGEEADKTKFGEAKVPGGVLVADFNSPNGLFRKTKFASFKQYDSRADILRANGVRLVQSNKASVDFEPEYVTIVGNNAYVVLQEANAIAVVDIISAQVLEIKPIGFIDRSRPGFGLDASDKDKKINIRNYPLLYGMPQPDTMSNYVASDGKRYLVFANEGDSKDSEEFRGEDITGKLNRKVSPSLKSFVEDKELLGRLKFSSIMGYNAKTNTQEKMFHFGSRSFSIMSLEGDIVFDSGEWMARIQEKFFPKIFNANHLDDEDFTKSQSDLFDNRSDDKGGEPESLSLLTTKSGKTYAFIGLERASIIIVFDITDARNPVFVDAVQNNPIDVPIGTLFAQGRQGDLDAEGLFASLQLKRLYVSGSVSNTLSSYDIQGL